MATIGGDAPFMAESTPPTSDADSRSPAARRKAAKHLEGKRVPLHVKLAGKAPKQPNK